MSRLRLPRLPRTERAPLPPELRWDGPAASVTFHLGRRDFLKALGVLLAALAAPALRVERALAKTRGNRSKAARLLGLTRSQLYSRMERYKLN